jgi:hypothetical protein
VKTRIALKNISTPTLSKNRARKAVVSPQNLCCLTAFSVFIVPPHILALMPHLYI